MSSWAAEIRRREAENRRQEREERRRQRDLERRLKETLKMSALEEARLEVESYENALEVLLSVHKDQSPPIEWQKFAAALPPHIPVRVARREFGAMVVQGIAHLQNSLPIGEGIEIARTQDERDYRALLDAYEQECAEWDRLRVLAKRVLGGEPNAYSEVIREFSSLGELPHLGSSVHFTVWSPRLIGCVLTVNGWEAIPPEMKTLTSSGKVSVKTMPKQRFHEIYQDYVCGCVLRLAREVLALLPIEEVLITASVHRSEFQSGAPMELPVLSAVITRTTVERLDFERLDPSDAIDHFVHRGDVKVSRKNGQFVPIVPLIPTDLVPVEPQQMDLTGLLGMVRRLRGEIGPQPKESPSDEHAAMTAPE